MKKLFSLLLIGGICAFVTPATAQFSASTLYGSFPNQYTSLDTVSNTGSKTYNFKITENRASVVFQVNGTKITGTVGGTIKVFGSVDGGNNFAQLNSTYTITDASQVYSYAVTGNPYTHYRITIAGTGTQSSSWRTYLMIR